MSPRTAAWLAWSLCLLGVALLAAGVFLHSPSAGAASTWGTANNAFIFLVVIVAFTLVGTLIASRLPANPIGWICLATGLTMLLSITAGEYGIYALQTRPGSLPAGEYMAWLANWVWAPSVVLIGTFLVLLFPNGRLPSRRWRVVGWLSVAVLISASASEAFSPGRLSEAPNVTNPLGIESARSILELVSTGSFSLLPLCIVASALSMISRFRRSTGEERQQLKWFATAAALLAIAYTSLFIVSSDVVEDFVTLTFAGPPVAVGIAVLKYRLYDIDVVINRTLVYGALTASIVGIYVFVVAYLGALFRATADDLFVSLLATGLVAVLFAPLRDQLQRAVNRLMYGERDDPYTVVSRLGERLESTLAPQAVLPTIIQAVREALKLPYAAITLRTNGSAAPTVAASVGKPVQKPLRLALSYQGEPLGELLLGERAPGEGFSPADRRLLEGLVRQAGVAAHAVRLTTELRRSRQRLVAAREEERRRLRRDLHDGLGAQLAALNVQASTLRRLIASDPEAADELLVELREELRRAIADIRRLVYDLRPPALDDLGLVGALHQLTERYGSEGERVRVVVYSPEDLPPLPAAVEVAVYRIVQEALTNVVRHARAKECVVRLAVDGDVVLEIVDDGVGIPRERSAGVGLSSMRERASELGGSCVIQPAAEGGTRVSVRLPLPKE